MAQTMVGAAALAALYRVHGAARITPLRLSTPASACLLGPPRAGFRRHLRYSNHAVVTAMVMGILLWHTTCGDAFRRRCRSETTKLPGAACRTKSDQKRDDRLWRDRLADTSRLISQEIGRAAVGSP